MIDNIMAVVFIVLGICLAYLMFALVPMALYADAKCLRNGYPKSQVTIGLEMYCTTLDGAVTVKVEKIK